MISVQLFGNDVEIFKTVRLRVINSVLLEGDFDYVNLRYGCSIYYFKTHLKLINC